MAINQTTILEDLSFLEGNQSVPASGIDDWRRFIQRTLEEAWRAFPWDFAKSIATLTVTNGVATLPSGAMIDAPLDVRSTVSGTGDDHIYVEVPYGEQDDWETGSYRYWVTGNQPNPVINTRESTTPLIVRYTALPPQINASIGAPFPDSMVIALGARRYVRMGENPTADTAQEEQIFQARLEEIWGWYNRNKPRSTRRFYPSTRTGQVGGD